MGFIKKVPSGVAVALCFAFSLSLTAIAVLWINGTYAAREKNRWQVAAAEFARAKERADGPVQEERKAAIPIKGQISVRGIDPDYGCNPPAEDRASDLCAQWKAADAAKEGANWVPFATVIALASLIATIISVWLFWKSLEDARIQRQQERRAYVRLKFKKPKVHMDSSVIITIEFTNYGQSPASYVSGECDFFIEDITEPNEVKPMFWDSSRFGIAELHPNAPETSRVVGKLNIGDFIEKNGFNPFQRRLIIRVHATAYFYDVFSSKRNASKSASFHIRLNDETGSIYLVKVK